MAIPVIDNDWVGYLDRSFQQIKTSLLSRVTNSNPEMTDHSETNIFVIIISMFSGVAEMLGFYIDNIAREAFMSTAQRRSSLVKHSVVLDYRIKARNPESADVVISWTDGGGTPRATLSAFTLLTGSSVSTPDGIVFRTVADVAIAMSETQTNVPFSQITQFTSQVLGVTDGTKNQQLSLGTTYVHNTASVVINAQSYTRQESLARSKPTEFHYIIDINDDGNAYLIFGDGINGIIPPTGNDVEVSYRTTTATTGKAAAGLLTTGVTLLGLPGDHDGTTNNALNSSGGADYEENLDIQQNSVRSIRTLNRMVTWEEHEMVMEEFPGISRAHVNFCCGKDIDLYIAPDGGGIASSQLIIDAQAEADLKKMLTSFPVVRPAGETRIVIGATVTAKPRADISQTKTAVEEALVAFGAVANQKINGSIKISDIQALIDNLADVDFVDLTSMYTIPYARPLDHVNTLVFTSSETLVASTAIVKYRAQYNSTGPDISLFRENIFEGSVPLDTTYVTVDGGFKFNIDSGGSYVDGNDWEWTVYPFLANIDLNDFTIATILTGDLGITVLVPPGTTRNPIC